jgi:hypothetical protein
MYYQTTIGYETEQLDRAGNPRLEKLKYIIEAESAEESILRAGRYIGSGMRSGEVLEVKQLPIECLITEKETPEYFKK